MYSERPPFEDVFMNDPWNRGNRGNFDDFPLLFLPYDDIFIRKIVEKLGPVFCFATLCVGKLLVINHVFHPFDG